MPVLGLRNIMPEEKLPACRIRAIVPRDGDTRLCDGAGPWRGIPTPSQRHGQDARATRVLRLNPSDTGETPVLRHAPREDDSTMGNACIRIMQHHAGGKAADRKEGGLRYLLRPHARIVPGVKKAHGHKGQ